jgi:hypothetical protein
MVTIKDEAYLSKLRKFQANLYAVKYKGLMKMIVESKIPRNVIEVLVNSKFKKLKAEPNKASQGQISEIFEYGIKAYDLNCLEAYCLIQSLKKVHGSPISPIVPSGRYKGKSVDSVPWNYILHVTDPSGLHYSEELYLFFLNNAKQDTSKTGNIPCGRFAGKPKSFADDKYIKTVTDKTSKYYSSKLDNYFNGK